jgi:hypothetical protein
VKTLAVAVSLAWLVACSGTDQHPDRPPSTVTFEGTDAFLYVDVAEKAHEQREGLMGVAELPTNQGIAFVYEEPVRSTFWMKNTLVPLSIAFVDEEGIVVGLLDMEPCGSDSCPSYGIEQPYVLAIEANLGWFDEHGIEPGDRAKLRVSAYG